MHEKRERTIILQVEDSYGMLEKLNIHVVAICCDDDIRICQLYEKWRKEISIYIEYTDCR